MLASKLNASILASIDGVGRSVKMNYPSYQILHRGEKDDGTGWYIMRRDSAVSVTIFGVMYETESDAKSSMKKMRGKKLH